MRIQSPEHHGFARHWILHEGRECGEGGWDGRIVDRQSGLLYDQLVGVGQKNGGPGMRLTAQCEQGSEPDGA
jgi:hypothetical protein